MINLFYGTVIEKATQHVINIFDNNTVIYLIEYNVIT